MISWIILTDAFSLNSQSIVYYLAEKYADFAGLGKTPEERAKVESVIFWAATTLFR